MNSHHCRGGSTHVLGRGHVWVALRLRRSIKPRSCGAAANYTIGPELTLELYGEPFARTATNYGLGSFRDRAPSPAPTTVQPDTIARDAGGNYTVTDNGGADTLQIPNPIQHPVVPQQCVCGEMRPGSTLYVCGPRIEMAPGYDSWSRIRDLVNSFRRRATISLQ